MVFFLILSIFLLFFFNFSITGLVGTHRNDFFYFLSFSAFPNIFWLGKKPQQCFLIFFEFFAIFLEFSITGRVRTHRNDFFFFFFLFSLFLSLPQHILARKEAIIVFSNFSNFLTIFLEFSIPGQVGTCWNDFFFFSLSLPFPTYFDLKRCHNGVF